MKFSDIKCPKCKEMVSMRNIISFDDENFQMAGIVYMIKCKKCDITFITELRKTGKVKIPDELEESFKQHMDLVAERCKEQ